MEEHFPSKEMVVSSNLTEGSKTSKVMLIFSKEKDYYDFYTDIYGRDDKLVLDRRSELGLEKPDSNESTVYGYFRRNPVLYRFAIGGYSYDVFAYKDKLYHTLEELYQLGKVLSEEHGIEVVPVKDSWLGRRYYNNPEQIVFINKEVSYYRKNRSLTQDQWKKYNGCETDVNTTHRYPTLLLKSTYRGYVKNFLLKDFGFPKWYTPEEMYIKVSSFVSWMVDNPPLPNNQTNVEKIVSKGFNTKTSFRPNMKTK